MGAVRRKEREGEGAGKRGPGKEGVGVWSALRALTCGCACLRQSCVRYGDLQKQSALHMASAEGLAGTVAKLLALGADAALTDKVRACPCVKI